MQLQVIVDYSKIRLVREQVSENSVRYVFMCMWF